MKKAEIDELLDEYHSIAPSGADSELLQVDAALFLESCLGLRIRNEDFSEQNLGGAAALRSFVKERAGS